MVEKSEEAQKDVFDELKKKGIPVGARSPIREYVSTGVVALDWAISSKLKEGGLPVGRVIEIFGDPSTGKSLLLLHIIKSAQQMGAICLLDDAEESFDEGFAQRIGVDLGTLTRKNSKTVEEHFTEVAEFVNLARGIDKKRLIVIALDSIAILSTKHEVQVGFEKPDMTKAKLIRQGMRVMRGEFSEQRVLYLVCNHVIASFNTYGRDKTTPGGGGVPFQSSIRIELSIKNLIKNEKNQIQGVGVKAVVVKNKIAPPFKSCLFQVSFEKGVDRFSGFFDVLVDIGCVQEKGAGWYIYKEKTVRRTDIEKDIENIYGNLETDGQ